MAQMNSTPQKKKPEEVTPQAVVVNPSYQLAGEVEMMLGKLQGMDVTLHYMVIIRAYHRTLGLNFELAHQTIRPQPTQDEDAQ